MSVPTSESQGWGPSLLGGLPGAQSPSCTGVRCCGVGVSGKWGCCLEDTAHPAFWGWPMTWTLGPWGQ